MNVENLDKLITHLKHSQPQNFDMNQWVRFDFNNSVQWASQLARDLVERLEKHADCGTVACVAGHAALLKATEDGLKSNAYAGWRASPEARDWLGLTYEESERLFEPRDKDYNIVNFSLDEAIDTLKHLRETGEIKWPREVSHYGDDVPWDVSSFDEDDE